MNTTKNSAENTINNFLKQYNTPTEPLIIYHPQKTLNGYPRTLINCLTDPQYQQKHKEICHLITTERLTHTQITIQNTEQHLNNLIQTNHLTIQQLQKQTQKLGQPQQKEHKTITIKRKIIKQTTTHLKQLLQHLISKKRILKGKISE